MSKDQNKVKEQEELDNNVQTEIQEETQVEEVVVENVDSEVEEVVEVNELEQLQEELSESKDKFLRLYAEFENFRKRSNKEKVDLLSTASAGVLKDLLTVLDDFERAIHNNENVEDPATLKEGFNLIHNKFKSILESKGLKPMQAKGERFDSEFHEAIANIPAPSEDQIGVVIDDVEKGYYLNEKVIRFAKVVVGQ